ncbi:MAG: hypothetical protein A3F72_01600 [Bacteroidetes bacterium RIFCSPLOWO2_12_FULL_35_15]|nr:MAG: hypothetical protein A3F72_01600 [Bacteroidetes bacterium RIFCSPLOWO2_12_FULL_35_15]
MKNSLSVFLIDNNEIDNFIHQRKLKDFSEDINVFTFQNATEALESIQKNNKAPQLILLNLYLTLTNGFEFLEAYEKLDCEKTNTFIYILSTTIRPSDLRLIKKNVNCFGYIEKPFSMNKLFEQMDSKKTEMFNLIPNH